MEQPNVKNIQGDVYNIFERWWYWILSSMISIIAIYFMTILLFSDILLKYSSPEEILNMGYYILFIFMAVTIIWLPLMTAAYFITLY